jgi:dolichol-phosphate mannosyltransferase
MPLELTVVIPTRNERENLIALIARLRGALEGISWEAVFVDDDSPDATHVLLKSVAAADRSIRCIRRVGRRGLSGACIEGILSSAAPFVAVMDADLQHDETLLPKMLDAMHLGADLVVATRYAQGGSSQFGFSSLRHWGSKAAIGMTRRFLNLDLSDPMSGFFMIRRKLVEDVAVSLWPHGFKLLLDIVLTSPNKLKIVELPFNFRTRAAGESKMGTLVTFEFLELLATKMTRGLLPARFLMFALVGATGIGVHLVTLQFLYAVAGWSFVLAQLSATFVAMTSNFLFNNIFTYSDRRLRGTAFFTGLLSFYLVCSLGTLANVSVANFLYSWDQAAPLISGLAGAIMSVVFNYAASKALTWRDI